MPPKGKSGKVAPSPKANAKGKGDGKGGDWEAKEAKMRAMQDALADAQAKRGATAAAASKERKARRKKRAKSVWRRSWEKLFGSKEEIKLRKKTKEMLSALMITEEEVRRMKSVFDDVDLDGAGEMDFDEFMEMIGEKRTPFTDAVFTVVDDPNTGIETITQEEIKQMEARDGPGTALKVRGHLSFDDFVQVSQGWTGLCMPLPPVAVNSPTQICPILTCLLTPYPHPATPAGSVHILHVQSPGPHAVLLQCL